MSRLDDVLRDPTLSESIEDLGRMVDEPPTLRRPPHRPKPPKPDRRPT